LLNKHHKHYAHLLMKTKADETTETQCHVSIESQQQIDIKTW